MTRTQETHDAELEALRQRVQDLEQRNEQYLHCLNQLAQGIFIYHLEDLDDDRTLRMVHANPAVGALTGADVGPMVGKTLDENFPGLREQGVPQMYANVIRTGEPVTFETVYGDEQVIESAFSVRAFPMPGQCIGIVFDNITQRKQTEQALQRLNAELEQRIEERTRELTIYKALVEHAPDGIGYTTADGTIIYANSAFLHMTRYDHMDELVGVNFLDIFQEPAEKLLGLMRYVHEQDYWKGKLLYRRKDNTTFPGEMTTFCIRNKQGEVYTVAGISRDITRQKQAEDELNLFKTIVERATDAIGFTDVNGVITYSNRAHRALFGYGDDIIGMPVQNLIAPEARERLEQGMQEIMAGGSWTGESVNVRKDGTTFPVEVSIFVIQDDDNNDIRAVVGFTRDITERKQTEAEHTAMQEQVIEAQRAALRELSSPLIPIADNVVIMPLIGSIDSGRAMMVMETLLEGVAAYDAEFAILDITGVQVVDTQVANALIQAAQAVRLLGAQVVLTGIGPTMAQTLVSLGADLSSIVTRGSLQRGIAYALA